MKAAFQEGTRWATLWRLLALNNEHGINIRFAECEIPPTTAHDSLASMLSVEEGTLLLLLDQVHVDDSARRVFQTLEVRLPAGGTPDVYLVDGPLTPSYAARGFLLPCVVRVQLDLGAGDHVRGRVGLGIA